MKERQSNFELVRILAILMIVSLHAFGFMDYTSLPANRLLGHVINAVGNTGVSLFILISGYFGISFKPFRFVQLVFLTTFYTVVVHVALNGLAFDMGLLQAVLVVPMYHRWFVICYLALMVVSPWLNRFVNMMDKVEYRRLLLVLFVMFTVLPTLSGNSMHPIVTGTGKSFIYIIYIYMVGRYIRLHNDVDYRRRHTLGVAGVMTLIIVVLDVAGSIISGKQCLILVRDCSFLILISSVALFYFFKSLRFRSTAVNKISSCVLAVYLLDDMRPLVDRYVVGWMDKGDSPLFVFYLFAGVFATFSIAVAIEMVRRFLLGNIESRMVDATIRVSVKAWHKAAAFCQSRFHNFE